MGKLRDLFKKIRDTKGTFHAKMGSIKDRNGKVLTKAEKIKKGDKNTEKNCVQKNCTKKELLYRRTVQKRVLKTQLTPMVWSLTLVRRPRV